MDAFRGNRLTAINDQQISTPDDVRSALEGVNPGDVVSLQFEDPTTPTDAPERWSIEVRCIAIYD